MEGHKILVTGLTGQVARPLALWLAERNEVWGLARFSDPEKRAQLEAGGIRCETLDLEAGDFASLPSDFDYVLHFAVSRAPEPDFDRTSARMPRAQACCSPRPDRSAPSSTARRPASTRPPATRCSRSRAPSATTTA